jgi:hypothetical protein
LTTPANVKLYESPSRAGGLPTINYRVPQRLAIIASSMKSTIELRL